MNCPIDGTDLLMTERQGIEIDYCPKCRGVWLDRGELDKIIDRTLQSGAITAPTQEPTTFDEHPRDVAKNEQRPRKRSLLGELFDF